MIRIQITRVYYPKLYVPLTYVDLTACGLSHGLTHSGGTTHGRRSSVGLVVLLRVPVSPADQLSGPAGVWDPGGRDPGGRDPGGGGVERRLSSASYVYCPSPWRIPPVTYSTPPRLCSNGVIMLPA